MSDYGERNLPYFQRMCLLISDLDQALALYQDLLGFKVEYIGVDDPDSYSYEIFNIPRNIQTRFATLSSTDQLRTLALIEVPGADIHPSDMLTAAPVIHVASVTDMLARAEAKGFKTTVPRTHPAPENGPGRSEAAIYDPDGHPVVVYELVESST